MLASQPILLHDMIVIIILAALLAAAVVVPAVLVLAMFMINMVMVTAAFAVLVRCCETQPETPDTSNTEGVGQLVLKYIYYSSGPRRCECLHPPKDTRGPCTFCANSRRNRKPGRSPHKESVSKEVADSSSGKQEEFISKNVTDSYGGKEEASCEEAAHSDSSVDTRFFYIVVDVVFVGMACIAVFAFPFL